MAPVIAVKRLVDEGVLVRLAQHLLQHGVTCGEVRRQEVVVLLAQHFDGIQFFEQIGIAGVVDLAG